MLDLWKRFSLSRSSPYKLARLVDSRLIEPPLLIPGHQHIVCDIDKTYLETEFESILRMARIAFEEAGEKVTVAGASDVLIAARWGDVNGEPDPSFPRSLHFVSSSPPQLRSVLEEKLTLDGLDWNSDTFKNQVYNIRKGRMDLLRHHIAYKSAAILKLIQAAGEGARFYMIGDNAESDGYIYTGIRLLLDGRLSGSAYQRYLELAGVEARVAEDLTRALPVGDRGVRVAAILIRNVPGYRLVSQSPLTDAILGFDDFFQAAILLVVHRLIEPDQLVQLSRSFHNYFGLSLAAIVADLEALAFVYPEYARSVEKAMQVLNLQDDEKRFAQGAGDADATTLRASLVRDLSDFNRLSETEILDHAYKWIQRLHEGRKL